MKSVFQKRLSVELKSRQWKPFDLSIHTRIRETTIRKWMDGKASPTASKLAILADTFECSMDYLWGRTKGRDNGHTEAPNA